MGLLTWLVLLCLKWSLLMLVVALGLGKTLAWLAGRGFNIIVRGLLLWRRVKFNIEGIPFRLVTCRLGRVEVDLLSGWLFSGGKLPCLGLVVGGVEIQLEACLRSEDVGATAKAADLAPVPSPSTNTDQTTKSEQLEATRRKGGQLRPFVVDFLSNALLQCCVAIRSIKVGIYCKVAPNADVHNKEWARLGDFRAELCVACVEARIRTLRSEKNGGLQLTLRVGNEPDVPLISSSLGTGCDVVLEGDATLEIDVVRPRSPELGQSMKDRKYLLSASRVRVSPLRAVIHEEDVQALVAMFQSRSSSGAFAESLQYRRQSSPPLEASDPSNLGLRTHSYFSGRSDSTGTATSHISAAGVHKVAASEASSTRTGGSQGQRPRSTGRSRRALVRSNSNTARAAESTPIWSLSTSEVETDNFRREYVGIRSGNDTDVDSPRHGRIQPETAHETGPAKLNSSQHKDHDLEPKRQQKSHEAGTFHGLLPRNVTNWMFLSRSLEFNAVFEAVRFEIIGSTASGTCSGSILGADAVLRNRGAAADSMEYLSFEDTPATLSAEESVNDLGVGGVGSNAKSKPRGTKLRKEVQVGANVRQCAGSKARMCAVMEIRGVQLSLSTGQDCGDASNLDDHKHIDKVSVIARWATAVLAITNNCTSRDMIDGRSRQDRGQASSSSAGRKNENTDSLPTPTEPAIGTGDLATVSEPGEGSYCRSACLPIHLGKLSCRAEVLAMPTGHDHAAIEGGQIDASARLALCRFVLSDEGLAGLLWFARLVPADDNFGEVPGVITRSRDALHCVDGDDQSQQPAVKIQPSGVVGSKTCNVPPAAPVEKPLAGNEEHPTWFRSLCVTLEIDRTDVMVAEGRVAQDASGDDSQQSEQTTKEASNGGYMAESRSACPRLQDVSTLLRLSIPHMGIRFRSGRNDDEEVAANVVACDGASCDGQHCRGATTGSVFGPIVEVTAEWLEGHLEVEDPGTPIWPSAPASVPTEKTAVPSEANRTRRSSSTDHLTDALPVADAVPIARDPDRQTPNGWAVDDLQRSTSYSSVEGENVYPGGSAAHSLRRTPSGPPAAAGNIVSEALGFGGPSSAGEIKVAPAPQPGLPTRVTHRVRWLAVRKVSLVMDLERYQMLETEQGAGVSSESDVGVGVSGKQAISASDIGGVSAELCSMEARASLKRTKSVRQRKEQKISVEVEGVWAEWTPALFFSAGKAGGMIITRLKDASLLPHPSYESSVRYEPLTYWSPPKARLASKSVPPAVRPHDPMTLPTFGPAPGFPALALGLPPIGLHSRAAACFANEIAMGRNPTTVPSTMNLVSDGNTNEADVDDSRFDSAKGGEAQRGSWRHGKSETDSGIAETENFRPEIDGGQTKQVLKMKAKDIHVEFPYVATADTGDMEGDDILRWLRRFRPVLLQRGESGKGNRLRSATPGSDGSSARGVRPTGDDKLIEEHVVQERQDEVLPAVHDGSTEPGLSQTSRRSSRLRRSAAWSCQHVQVEEFGLTAMIADGARSSNSGGEGMVPDLCCALSEISVSTAGYIFDRDCSEHDDESSPQHDEKPDPKLGRHRDAPVSRRPAPSLRAKASVLPSEERLDDIRIDPSKTTRSSASVATICVAPIGPPSATVLSGAASVSPRHKTNSSCSAITGRPAGGSRKDSTSMEMEGFPVAETIETEAAAVLPKGVARSRLSEAIGGTRHCVESRARILHVARFAVVQMLSDECTGEDGGDDADRRSGSRAVDILAEGVTGDWTPSTRLQIIKPVREVTLSVWKVMLHLRRAFLAPLSLPASTSRPSTSSRQQHTKISRGGGGVPSTLKSQLFEPTGGAGAVVNDTRSDVGSVAGEQGEVRSQPKGFFGHDRNPAWEDEDALDYWLRAWAAGGPPGPSGDTLHRLHVRNVAIRGQWPPQPSPSAARKNMSAMTSGAFEEGISAEVRVGEFLSEAVGDHFKFLHTMVDFDGDRLASVTSLNLTRTLGDQPLPPPRPAPDRRSSAPTAPETEHLPDGDDSDLSLPLSRPPTEASKAPTVSTNNGSASTTAMIPVIVGACFHELKARAMAVHDRARASAMRVKDGSGHGTSPQTAPGNHGSPSSHGINTICSLSPWVLPLVRRPEGFLIEVEGVTLRAEKGKELGKRLDSLALQVRGLVAAQGGLPGRWHPLRGGPCADFHSLFWNPPKPEEVFDSSSGRCHDRAWGTHIWLRARDLSVEIGDEPLEAWVEAMHPVWSRELSARAFRHALFRRQGRALEEACSGDEDFREEDARSYVTNVRESFDGCRPPLAFPRLSKKSFRSKIGDVSGASPSLLQACVGYVSADMSPPANGESRCRSLLERLDQHPPPVGTVFGLLTRMKFSTRCGDILVHLRRFCQPLFACENVCADGVVMGARAKAPPKLVGREYIALDDHSESEMSERIAPADRVALETNTGILTAAVERPDVVQVEETQELDESFVTLLKINLPLKLYLDLAVCLDRPRFEYSPAHAFALVDLAKAGKLLCPPRLFSQTVSSARRRAGKRQAKLSWWDSGRSMMHGNFDASVIGGVALLAASTFTSPTSRRLPSRERLASIALRTAADSSAAGGSFERSERHTRRGSYPPADGIGLSDLPSTVGDSNISTKSGDVSAAGLDPGSSSSMNRNSWRRRRERGEGCTTFPSPPPSEYSTAFGVGGGEGSMRSSTGATTDSGGSHGGRGRSTWEGYMSRTASSSLGSELRSTSNSSELTEARDGNVLAVSCIVLRVGRAGTGHITLQATGICAEANPAPAPGLPPFLEIPILRCNVVTEWQCLGGSSPDHWVYVRPSTARAQQKVGDSGSHRTFGSHFTLKNDTKVQPALPAIRPLPSEADSDDRDDTDHFALFRAKGVSFQMSASLPNRPTGGDLPPLPQGVELPAELVSALCALPPRMSISVFGCCLRWAVEWGTCFAKIPPVPIPPRKCKASSAFGHQAFRASDEQESWCVGGRPAVEHGDRREDIIGARDSFLNPVEGFTGLVRGLRLGPVSLSEVDASAYDTAPADVRKRGVRLTIRGGVTSSLSFSVESSGAINPFTTGRVVIPDASQVVTTVHGLRLSAERVEARLCDRSASSRGSLLLRIKRVALEQGIGENNLHVRPTDSRAVSSRSECHISQSLASAQGDGVLEASRWSHAKSVHVGSSRKTFSASATHSGIILSDSESDGTASDDRTEELVKPQLLGARENESSASPNVGATTSGAARPGMRPDTHAFHQTLGVFDSGGFRCSPKSSTDVAGKEQAAEDLAPGEEALASWASRGGVPPNLDLLPIERLDEVLASGGEASGDEDSVDADSLVDGGATTDGARAAEKGRFVREHAGGQTRSRSADEDNFGAADAGGDRTGGDEGSVGEESLGDDSLGEGSLEGDEGGRWDSRLDAITRAAWLSSKQASCRRFNSNSSTASAVSDTGSAASGAVDRVSYNIAQRTSFAVKPGGGSGGNGGRVDRGPPPALPPRNAVSLPSAFAHFSPSVAAFAAGHVGSGRSSREPDVSGPSGAARVAGGGVIGDAAIHVEASATETGSRSAQEERGVQGSVAGHRASDRVAGSGFLYRVVMDGLNILITLKLRDSLLLLGQSALDVAIAALPELAKPSKALLAKECEGELRGEVNRRTSLDLKQFIDKPLALPGRRRDSGSLTPFSKAERTSQDSVQSLTARSSAEGGGIKGLKTVGVRKIPAGVGAGPAAGNEGLHKLFSIELRRTQIQLLGSETAKASLLYSMEQGTVQGWVGLDPVEEASTSAMPKLDQEDDIESCRLQCLAQRLLSTFQEAVTVSLEGTMLSAAPSDVDVDAGVQWLPDSALSPQPPVTDANTEQGEGEREQSPNNSFHPTFPHPAATQAATHSAASNVPWGTEGRRDEGLGSRYILSSSGSYHDTHSHQDLSDPQQSSGRIANQEMLDEANRFTPSPSPVDGGPAISAAPTATPAGYPATYQAARVPRIPSPVFGSGEWAAAGGSFHHLSEPFATSSKDTTEKLSFGFGPDGAGGTSESSRARASVAANADVAPSASLLPSSPRFLGRLEKLEDGGEGDLEADSGHWGAEGAGGGLEEESPSRVRERAARKRLMRQTRGSQSGNSFHLSLEGSALGATNAGVVSGLLGSSGRDSLVQSIGRRKGSLLSQGRSVFKPVVNRVDSLLLQVLAHHGAVENSVVKVDMPAIKAALNSLELKLVATVAFEVLASPLPNLPMLGGESSSTTAGPLPRGSGGRRDTPAANVSTGSTGMGFEMGGLMSLEGGMGGLASSAQTVTSAWAAKRKADWECLELRRLRYYIAEASYGAGNPTKSRDGGMGAGVESGDAGAVSPRSSLRRHYRLSPPPDARGNPLVGWAMVVEDEALASSLRSLSASERLRKAVKTLKQRLQQRPNTHLGLHLASLKLELWRDESSSPFLRAEVRGVSADVMVYDDSSGSLDLQVGSIWVSQIRGYAMGDVVPEGLDADEAEDEWWRAGGGGSGETPLVALEVLKPLLRQDLDRLSDQGNMRGWSPREVTVHVQAQLGSPIRAMVLVRHFEASVFPLVIHLRRSLFADLAAFSSDALVALSGGGAAADASATQREEQIKASFLTSRKAMPKAGTGRSHIGRGRLRRTWRGKTSSTVASSAAATTPSRDSTARSEWGGNPGGLRGASFGDEGDAGSFSTAIRRGLSTVLDSASDVGDVVDEAREGGYYHPVAGAGSTIKENYAPREDKPGVFERKLLVKHLRLGEVNVFLSYMGESYMELEDVDNVHLKLHPLVYTNKQWTPKKLLLRMRRDVILDVLSQVSRNFSNLGNFLNTRFVTKSGGAAAANAPGSSSHHPSSRAATTKTTSGSTKQQTTVGRHNDGQKEGKKITAGIAGSPKPGKSNADRAVGRQFSPLLLVETFSAVSRSVSPGTRPTSMRETRGTVPVSVVGGDVESSTGGSVLTPGGKRNTGKRMGWGHGSWAGSSTPRSARAASSADTFAQLIGEGAMNLDKKSEDSGSNNDTPITIGPAAAEAAAAAAEQFDAEEALFADESGSAPAGTDSVGRTPERTSTSTAEHDAKRLLFGPQLGGRGGASGGAGTLTGGSGHGTSGGGTGSGSMGGSGKTLRGMGLPSKLKRLTKSGKRPGDGGGGTGGQT